jgi:hypothetical protein
MSYTDFKEISIESAGTALRYGGNDLKQIMQIFNNKIVANRRPTIKNEWLWTDHFDMTPPAVAPGNPTDTDASRIYADPTDKKVKVRKTGGSILDIENINIPDSALNQITNKAKLPSTIVYTDQANVYGDFNQQFRSTRLRVTNPANTFSYSFIGSAIVADRNVTLPLLTANDVAVMEAFAQTLTNKTISGASNTLSNIADSSLLQIADKAKLPSSTVFNDQSNTFGDFDQVIRSSRLVLRDSDNSHSYIFIGSNLTANRNVTLPLLTANDILVLEAFAQTLTNKTINASNNTITNIGDAAIAAHTSTKITITTKGQLNSSIFYEDEDNNAGDHFMEFGDITAPSNPAAGVIRLFNNSATGELSVRKSGGTTVSLETGGGGSSTLDGLTDVVITSPADNQVLTYDSGSGNWINEAPTGGGGGGDVFLNASNTYGDFDSIFRSTRLKLRNPANTFSYSFVGSAITAARDVTLPLLTANDVFVMEAFAQTLTNKTIAAGSNTISGIVDANIDAHTSTKITITTKGQLNSAIVYNDQANTFGDFDQIIRSSRLIVRDSDNSHGYLFVGSNLTANRNVTLPLLTGNDIFVMEAFAQTLTNKTIAAGSNTISGIVDANISAHTSTKITITSKSLLNSAIVYTDQTNTFGAFDQIFPHQRLLLGDSNASHNYIFAGSDITANRTITLPLLTANDTFAVLGLAQTFTAKQTIQLDSPTILDLYRPSANTAELIFSHNNASAAKKSLTAIDSVLVDSTAGSEDTTMELWVNKNNSWLRALNIPSDGLFAFRSNDTGPVEFVLSTSGLTATRTFTFPNASDVIAGIAATQTLTNKTINSTDNSITATSQATGDILSNNGSKFIRKARGTSLQVLRTNSGATDIEWASLDSERVGKSTASGNGSTTQFNIAHGLGSNPTYAFISVADCGSTMKSMPDYTTDATNIVVTFGTAPESGTNNVVIYWRVVA